MDSLHAAVLDLQAAAILLLLLLCPPTPTPGNGSGIVWDSAGHIVTNYHVLQSALAKFGASPNAPLSSSAPNPAVGKKVALVTIEVRGEGAPWVRAGRERGKGGRGAREAGEPVRLLAAVGLVQSKSSSRSLSQARRSLCTLAAFRGYSVCVWQA